jgi:hypothetical protein
MLIDLDEVGTAIERYPRHSDMIQVGIFHDEICGVTGLAGKMLIGNVSA